MSGRPLLVGLNNPYSTNPAYALYPYPSKSTGARLLRLLQDVEPGFSRRRYLETFDRANLWPEFELPRGPGRTEKLRAAGAAVYEDGRSRLHVVLLGRDVWNAVMACPPPPYFEDFEVNGLTHFHYFPHPSGRNVVLNDEANRARFGEALAAIGRRSVGGGAEPVEDGAWEDLE